MATQSVSPTQGQPTQGEAWNPPGGDALLDDLFPNDEPQVNTSPAPAAPQAPAEPAAPPQPPEPPPFVLETKTGTRYRNIEEAVRGTEQKDELIRNLRNAVVQLSGVDPVNGRAVPQEPQSYLANPQRYVEDLAEAAEKKDWARYAGVQARYIGEVNAAQLGAYLPAVQEAGRMRAMEQVSGDIDSFRHFYHSPAYAEILDKHPELREIISFAETNPQYGDRLPGLYRAVYELAAGRNSTSAPATPQPVHSPQPRPTLTSSTQLPPPATGSQLLPGSVDELMRTSAGRQQIIKMAQDRGVEDLRW